MASKEPAKVPRRCSDVNEDVARSRGTCAGPVAFDRNPPATTVPVLSNLCY